MDSQISFLMVFIVLLFANTSAAEHESIQFTYSGKQGPDNWGSLSPSFAACSSGTSQSPIGIKRDEIVRRKCWKTLIRNYKPANATLVNNGYNLAVGGSFNETKSVVKYESDGGDLIFDGKKYTLQEIHWHVPSEHQIDGVQYDAELHLVHQAVDDKSPSVVSMLFEYGGPDPFVARLQDALKKTTEAAQVSLGIVNNKLLGEKTSGYYTYMGSLTTPPCSENVVWNIPSNVREISKEQVEALTAPLADDYKKNARPLQPLNGREIELYGKFN